MTALRVLLVEDTEDDALLIARELRRYGLRIEPHRVETEQELGEALARASWDLAILDHNLPGFGGPEALRLLQEHGFGGPMIIVSGTIDEQTAVEVMRAGAHDYVMKDNLARLGPAIERELRDAEARRERQRTQEALDASERQSRTLIETMGDGLTMIDPEHRVTYANEAFAEMVGYRLDELVGVPLEQLYAPSSQERLAEQLARRFAEGVSAEYEATLLSRDGREIPVLTHATTLRDDAGEIVGALAVIKDITQRARAEARVRESEERLRAVFDASPDGVVALTADGRIIDCNASIVGALGARSTEDLIGKAAIDFIAPDQREDAVARLREVLRVGAARSLEYDVVSLDGERFPVEVSANAISDEEGNPVGVVLALQDISARRASEHEVQQLNQFRHSIIDQANIWLHVLDRDLNTIVWNPAAAEMTGVSPEEALHSHFTWEVMYPDPNEREAMLGTAREIIEEGRVLENHETIICTRSGGTRSISWNARRLLDAGGEPIGLLATARDVTEHKQLETQLRQAVKMEAIGRLAGGIAHDFNNMLTAILGNVQLISMRMDESDDNQRLLGEIRVAARRSADLTRQLLAFSRKQAMVPVALDLNAVIERIEPMLQRMIGEDISVLTNFDPYLGLTMADPSQTDQVLMNLVVNARDAMPDGGILTIETANAVLDESYAAGYADLQPGRYVMLSVSDTGIGMDRETQERIFEPFFTTKPEDRGTGLGLATVYGIVSQSGGHIYVYSEPGEGTVFKVYLPLLESGEAADLDERAGSEDLTGRETILLVEDEDIVRDLIATVLRRHGHSVLTAPDADEALEIAAGYDGQIDIMVTDVVMPGDSGPELARAMAQIRPEMPVLFISGYAENMVARQGVLQEGVHYLQKPFDPEKLLRKIRAVLSGER